MKAPHTLLIAMLALCCIACGNKTRDDRDDRDEYDDTEEYLADTDIDLYLVAGDEARPVIAALAATYPQLSEMILPNNASSFSATVKKKYFPAVDSLLSTPAAAQIIGNDLKAAWCRNSINGDVGSDLYLIHTPAIFRPSGPVHVSFKEADNYDPYEAIDVRLVNEDARTWATVTRNNIGRQLAIMIGGEIISAPVVQSEILGGHISITGYGIRNLFEKMTSKKPD